MVPARTPVPMDFFRKDPNWVLVGSIFTTLPMVFLGFFFQRYIIKSVATTGGK